MTDKGVASRNRLRIGLVLVLGPLLLLWIVVMSGKGAEPTESPPEVNWPETFEALAEIPLWAWVLAGILFVVVVVGFVIGLILLLGRAVSSTRNWLRDDDTERPDPEHEQHEPTRPGSETEDLPRQRDHLVNREEVTRHEHRTAGEAPAPSEAPASNGGRERSRPRSAPARRPGTNLSGKNLARANLAATTLTRSDLSDADLTAADLRGANLRLANLRHANLTDADLSRANLCGATLLGARLDDTNLSGIVWNEQTQWPEGFTPPAREAPASRRHVISSRSSTTGCATARSVASTPTRREVGHDPAQLGYRHDPHRCGRLRA